jgi:hypothetical protein
MKHYHYPPTFLRRRCFFVYLTDALRSSHSGRGEEKQQTSVMVFRSSLLDDESCSSGFVGLKRLSRLLLNTPDFFKYVRLLGRTKTKHQTDCRRRRRFLFPPQIFRERAPPPCLRSKHASAARSKRLMTIRCLVVCSNLGSILEDGAPRRVESIICQDEEARGLICLTKRR